VTGERAAATVYWRPGCPYCSRRLSDLDRIGLPLHKVNIWEDPAAANTVRSIANGNETVPTVVVGDTAMVNPRAAAVVDAARRHTPDLLIDPDPAIAGLTAVLLCTSSAVAAPGGTRSDNGGQPLSNEHAYVFTQQQRDNLSWWNGTWIPQTVSDGAHIQVLLPSDPIRWTPDTGPTCQPSPTAGLVPTWLLPLRSRVELYDHSTLPNEGRISGSSALSVFDYRVTGLGVATICLRPDPPTDDPEVLGFTAGTPPFYVVTMIVGVPQITVP
jgi:glutaredoxin